MRKLLILALLFAPVAFGQLVLNGQLSVTGITAGTSPNVAIGTHAQQFPQTDLGLFDSVSGASLTFNAVHVEDFFTSSTAGAFSSYDAEATVQGSTSYSRVSDYVGRTIFGGNGTLTLFNSFSAASTNNGGGTIVTYKGFDTTSYAQSGGSTTTNYYGHSCSVTPVVTSTAYCIYDFTALPSHLGGNVDVSGTFQPTGGFAARVTKAPYGQNWYLGDGAPSSTTPSSSVLTMGIANNTIVQRSVGVYGWTSSASDSSPNATCDTGFDRSQSGVVGVNLCTTATDTQGSMAMQQWYSAAVATSALKTCTASTGKPWRGSVNDATAPAVGSPLTGGGMIFANVHCSLTTGTYIVDGI